MACNSEIKGLKIAASSLKSIRFIILAIMNGYSKYNNIYYNENNINNLDSDLWQKYQKRIKEHSKKKMTTLPIFELADVGPTCNLKQSMENQEHCVNQNKIKMVSLYNNILNMVHNGEEYYKKVKDGYTKIIDAHKSKEETIAMPLWTFKEILRKFKDSEIRIPTKKNLLLLQLV